MTIGSTSLRRRPLVAALLLGASLGAALPAQAATVAYEVGPASEISYMVVHPMHQVHASSHALTGRLGVADGKLVLPATLRLPLLSFDSGNGSRDSNAATTLNVGRFPLTTLEVESFAESARLKEGTLTRIAGTATGKLTLHGVTRPVSIPLTATLSAATLAVDATFSVSLTDYQIPRPSLLFRPIDDDVKLTVHLVAAPAR